MATDREQEHSTWTEENVWESSRKSEMFECGVLYDVVQSFTISCDSFLINHNLIWLHELFCMATFNLNSPLSTAVFPFKANTVESVKDCRNSGGLQQQKPATPHSLMFLLKWWREVEGVTKFCRTLFVMMLMRRDCWPWRGAVVPKQHPVTVLDPMYDSETKTASHRITAIVKCKHGGIVFLPHLPPTSIAASELCQKTVIMVDVSLWALRGLMVCECPVTKLLFSVPAII